MNHVIDGGNQVRVAKPATREKPQQKPQVTNELEDLEEIRDDPDPMMGGNSIIAAARREAAKEGYTNTNRIGMTGSTGLGLTGKLPPIGQRNHYWI